MKKIVLLCAGGASTGMLVKKMLKVTEESGKEYEIVANGVAQAVTVAARADVILLGPQVAYQEEQVKKELPKIPVSSINMTDYGMMNAAKIIQQAEELMEGN